jgi:predicted MFS family arabinose efflux permease
MAIGYCGQPLVDGIGLLTAFLTLIIVGFMFTRATLTFELSRSASINRQGMIMGFNQSLMSVANIAAPLISGTLIGHSLYVAWSLSMAGISICGTLLAAALLVARYVENV